MNLRCWATRNSRVQHTEWWGKREKRDFLMHSSTTCMGTSGLNHCHISPNRLERSLNTEDLSSKNTKPWDSRTKPIHLPELRMRSTSHTMKSVDKYHIANMIYLKPSRKIVYQHFLLLSVLLLLPSCTWECRLRSHVVVVCFPFHHPTSCSLYIRNLIREKNSALSCALQQIFLV